MSPTETRIAPPRSPRATFLKRLVKEKPLGLIGAIIVLTLLLVGIFADFLIPYDPNKMNLRQMLQPPSAEHLLGTDHLGQDLFSRLIKGAQVSAIVGIAGTSISTLVSLIIGIISGYFGGKADMVIQRFVDAWIAFPIILILISVMALVGTGMVQIIVALGISIGIGGSRIIRGAVIGIKANQYLEAARAIGTPAPIILLRYVLPNIAAPVIVLFSLTPGGVILAEAALSFLGYGLPPNIPSWGSMLSGEGRQYMELAPQLAFWSGAFLTLVVFGINVFGDAVRDLLELSATL